MITITRNNNNIHIEGHSTPVVCAGVSSVLYTTVNLLLMYNSECIDFIDNKELDCVDIDILIEDEFVTMFLDNMFNMFKDIQEMSNNDITIKV